MGERRDHRLLRQNKVVTSPLQLYKLREDLSYKNIFSERGWRE